jgi:ATP-dependent helicase/nuclease subunit B
VEGPTQASAPQQPRHGRPRLFSIAPGDPFLPRIAHALLDGRIVDGFSRASGPLAMAAVTILVPTRRAARALRPLIAAAWGEGSALLPDIRPLGEFEDQPFDPPTPDGAEAAGMSEGAPPVGVAQRLLALAPLVERWRRLTPQSLETAAPGGMVLPASKADAIWLARELAALLDESETQEANLAALAALGAQADIADWWRMTAQFLAIIDENWPAFLTAANRINPARHRTMMIDAFRHRLETGPQDRVIIAAGSTGSIPATARLLATIARMPNGAVILPGFDADLPPEARDALAEADDPSCAGHPQYGLSRLLQSLQATADDVCPLGAPPSPLAHRAKLVSLAMLPAAVTDIWAASPLAAKDQRAALDAVTLVEAANERDEALAIAAVLRQAAAVPGKTAALVTPDRALARRVSAELARFAITADDSGGTPLTTRWPGSFLMRAADCLFTPGDGLALLSLLKHPLFRLGMPRGHARAIAEQFELFVLRGRNGRPALGRLSDELRKAQRHHAEHPHPSTVLKRLPAQAVSALDAFATALDAAISSEAALRDDASVAPLAHWLRSLVAVAENLASDGSGGFGGLYAGEDGRKLATALRDLIAAGDTFELAARDVPDVLAALLSGEIVKPQPGGHPRIFIWGQLEARLQHVDLMVLGGLNEGVWPQVAETGPFLSRLMQRECHLEPPERRIGQAAHDFEQFMGAGEVVLSRALHLGDAPSEPSRWLQRMLAVADADEVAAMRARGASLLASSRGLDAPAPDAPEAGFAPRPEPRPPLAMRPRHFSVSEIETLRRDPYAAFARKVLRLEPLEALIADPGPRERGTLYHEILHDAAREPLDFTAPDAEKGLLRIADAAFMRAELPGEISALWWARFAELVPHIVAFEAARSLVLARRQPEEQSARHPVGATGVTLSAKADRIDIGTDGFPRLIDFKSGTTPSKGDIQRLHAPQLPLEIALVANGAFGPGIGGGTQQALIVRLSDKGGFVVDDIGKAGTGTVDINALGDDAWQALQRLLHFFNDPQNGYVSRAFPARNHGRMAREAPYDHLARVFEWSATGGDSDDEGDDAEDAE